MIVTTTQSVEGKRVSEYLGIVAGQDSYNPSGLLGEGWLTGSGNNYMAQTMENAQRSMASAARGLNADAVIGVTSSASMSSLGGGRVMIYVCGTAVKLADADDDDELPAL